VKAIKNWGDTAEYLVYCLYLSVILYFTAKGNYKIELSIPKKKAATIAIKL
jgi:hypothetical protein